jgi:tRNA-specific 2-thiouridylase
MATKIRVVVAMSGGVDSSVAAALLAKQGYQVIGMMLRLWNEPGKESANRCCTPDAIAQARRVSAILGIPFYVLDAQDVFYTQVVEASFLQGYARGVTPNPCLSCNRQIRWGFLLQRALALGADWMATGHYARLGNDDKGRFQLRCAADPAKDQSYVLHVLGQEQLAHALFPLGEYTKPQVRELARQFGLPVAERAESQDLCFLAKDDPRSFLLRHAPQVEKPGPILARSGQTLGTHPGLAFYTIGQRKGLGIPSLVPLYVLEKDLANNALIVGPKEELGRRELITGRIHWISGETPEVPFRAQVKIRYRSGFSWGKVTPLEEGGASVLFDEPLRDITPGQAAVFYKDEVVLGGGIILEKTRPEAGDGIL